MLHKNIRLSLALLLTTATITLAADDAADLLRQGADNYDSTLLQQAITTASRNPEKYGHLFTATCYWRMQTINYVTGNKKGITRYGLRALSQLDSAELNSEDAYQTETRRASVNQLMAGTGIKNGATYGPRIAKNLDRMKKLNPDGFETRLTETVNFLEMPAFVGGNPKKALTLLTDLYRDYPDSVAAGLSLSRAMMKNGRKAEAAALLRRILGAHPRNLMARKSLDELESASSEPNVAD